MSEKELELIKSEFIDYIKISRKLEKIGTIANFFVALCMLTSLTVITYWYYLFFSGAISFLRLESFAYPFLGIMGGIIFLTLGVYQLTSSILNFYEPSNLRGFALFVGTFMRLQGIIALFLVAFGLSFLITTILYLIYIL